MIWFILYVVVALALMVVEGYANFFEDDKFFAFVAALFWPLLLIIWAVVIFFIAPFKLGEWLAKEPKP